MIPPGFLFGWGFSALMGVATFSQNGHFQRKVHTEEYSREFCLQCPSPTTSHSHPLFSQEILQELQSNPTQIPMESLLCPGIQCTGKPVCAFQEWDLRFPQSFGNPEHKPHWSSMPDAVGAISYYARSPGVET